MRPMKAGLVILQRVNDEKSTQRRRRVGKAYIMYK